MKRGEANVQHGHARKRKHSGTYRSWYAMKQRCSNPKNKEYSRYGGAGIRVCTRWESFSLFVHDMGERPVGRSLDRRDSSGDYTPKNCRWVTPQEQARNMRSNLMLTVNGTTKCLAAWAEESSIAYNTIKRRIQRGWEPKRAIFEEVL